jgi:hypothetical protein
LLGANAPAICCCLAGDVGTASSAGAAATTASVTMVMVFW